jgi:hypothetical protein
MDFFHQKSKCWGEGEYMRENTAYHRDQHTGIASSAQTPFPHSQTSRHPTVLIRDVCPGLALGLAGIIIPHPVAFRSQTRAVLQLVWLARRSAD